MGGLSIVAGSLASAAAVSAVLLRGSLPVPVLFLLGHAALTGCFIAASASDTFGERTSGLLGKDKVTGRFVPGSCLAAWPFHLALHARIRLRRARTKEPLYQLVEDGWYISGWPYCASVLPNEENLAVVDCTCEYPRCHDKPYLCIPTWDTQGQTWLSGHPFVRFVAAPTNPAPSTAAIGYCGRFNKTCSGLYTEQVRPLKASRDMVENVLGHRHACAGVSVANLAKSMEFVQAQRRLGRAILVHCAHGHGRSAQVLLACMIALGFYKTHQEGLAALQKLRPKCKLNRPQLRNLELYLGGVGLLQK